MMTPAGFDHGRIAIRIDTRLEQFVEASGLGVVTTADSWLPDCARPGHGAGAGRGFCSGRPRPVSRLVGFFQGPPDLAVEVVSPGDRRAEVEAKSREWLAAGCRMVWVVDPETTTVAVYRPDAGVRTLRVPEVLDGGDVVPGLRLPLAEIFGG